MAIGKMPGARQGELFVAASADWALDNPFYAEPTGRPGPAPSVFLGYGLAKTPPEHSTPSKTRKG